MKTTHLASALLAAVVLAATASDGFAQHGPRNPGGGGGGGGTSSGGGGGGGGGSFGGGGSDGGTGRVAVPRGGGESPWGGGGRTVSSRPSEPSTSSGGRRPARVSGGSAGAAGLTVPPYSRPNNGRPVTGYAVPRGTVATLPPIISGPVYWGPDNWYFYPWGFGGMGLGYFWDPWMWSGMWGMGGFGGWGGYPYDPLWGGVGGGGWGGGGGGGYDTDTGQPAQMGDVPNPLDPNAPTGGLRLKVEPRDAEVLVDGYYAGRVDDFDGAMQRLKITEGPHRIELRAPGHEPTTFDVVIVVGQTTTYKTELKKR